MFPFTVKKGRLLREVNCSYGSASRRKMTYPLGKEVDVRVWDNGSVDLLDGMFQIVRNASPEDYELMEK